MVLLFRHPSCKVEKIILKRFCVYHLDPKMILEFLRLSHGHHRIEALFTQQQRCIQKAPLFKGHSNHAHGSANVLQKNNTKWLYAGDANLHQGAGRPKTWTKPWVFLHKSHTCHLIQPSILWDLGHPACM